MQPTPPFGDTADFDDPFAILEACHERIARVRRYVELAGPDHHADEELDLFPVAREAASAAGASDVVATLDALQREHREMDEARAALRAHLDALCADGGEVDAARVARFATLYRTHVACEEGVVHADAKRRPTRPVRDALARAIVARRRR